MGDSDRRDPARWPQIERRGGGDRRSAPERRVAPASGAASSRPQGAERRQAGRRKGGDRRDESGWQQIPLELPAPKSVLPEQRLLDAAAAARHFAQAHYSGFQVGAALETTDGTIVTGCNIENATYGLTLCAERVALVKALSDGYTAFARIAVLADTKTPTPPCGACRQLLWEYCGDIEVLLGNLGALTGRHRLRSLLPLPFDRRLLE